MGWNILRCIRKLHSWNSYDMNIRKYGVYVILTYNKAILTGRLNKAACISTRLTQDAVDAPWPRLEQLVPMRNERALSECRSDLPANRDQITKNGRRPRLIKSNQIKSNQIKSNQIKSNQIKSNQIKSNQIKSNQIKSKQSKAKQSKAKQSKAKQSKAKQSKANHFMVLKKDMHFTNNHI